LNKPQGAFYVFMDVSSYFGSTYDGKVMENDVDLCMYLLDKGHVALVPGSAFGNAECIRISYATSIEALVEALKRLKNAFAELKK
jgi:aspartate aminotransferase